ncbi:unnamed protein product [Miscanthus lutarioriparius]|uniref:WAT1-related protein n=1 Tax=Miscanthus lutarioriparius TaxID=422564 RepID=A0A811S6L0_9POAL|nr:unnamed protein product [Miscanthus lutarioriparius]
MVMMRSCLGGGLPVAVMFCLNVVAAVMEVEAEADAGDLRLHLRQCGSRGSSASVHDLRGPALHHGHLRDRLLQHRPVLTFLLAVATRSEALDLKSRTGMAKLLGTLVSLAGAMVLTLYKGVALTHAAAADSQNHHQHLRPHAAADAAASRAKWTLGTVAILGNCVCLSCWFLLHGRLAKKYPHVYSCNALMSLISFLQVAVVGLCTQRSISPWIITSKFNILTVLYAGIVGCGVSFVLVTWCIEKRGAVFVAAFIPVVQIIVSVIDFSILHEQLYLGSVLGSVLVIGGLYLLLWGKRQEALHCPPPPKVEEDAADKEQQQVQHN